MEPCPVNEQYRCAFRRFFGLRNESQYADTFRKQKSPKILQNLQNSMAQYSELKKKMMISILFSDEISTIVTLYKTVEYLRLKILLPTSTM